MQGGWGEGGVSDKTFLTRQFSGNKTTFSSCAQVLDLTVYHIIQVICLISTRNSERRSSVGQILIKVNHLSKHELYPSPSPPKHIPFPQYN